MSTERGQPHLIECRFAFNFANVLTVAGHHARGLMICAGTDGAVWLWDLEGNSRGRLTGHSNWIRSAGFAPGGMMFATASSDGTLRIWSSDGPSAQRVVDVSRKRLWAIVWVSAEVVAVGDDTGVLSLVNAATGDLVATAQAHSGRLNVLCVAQSLLLSGGVDGRVTLRSSADLTQVATVDVHAPVTGASFDERLGLAAVTTANELWVFEVKDDRATGIRRIDLSAPATAVVLLTGERVACVGDSTGGLTWIDLESELPRLRLRAHDAAVTAVVQLGTRLLTGGEDQALRQWDAESGLLIGVVKGGVNHAWSLAALDDDLVVSAHEDRELRIWTKGPQRAWVETRSLLGHRNRIWSVRSVRGGAWLISASEDGSARVWDVATGRCLRTLDSHDGPVWSADMTSNGEIAFTVGDEGMRMPPFGRHPDWFGSVLLAGKGCCCGHEEEGVVYAEVSA